MHEEEEKIYELSGSRASLGQGKGEMGGVDKKEVGGRRGIGWGRGGKDSVAR